MCAMRSALTILIAMFVCAIATAQQPVGEEPYRKVCLACHGPLGRGDAGPRLVPLAKGSDEVLAIVREGSGQMPPISRIELTDEEILQIVEYLKFLSVDRPGSVGAAMRRSEYPAHARRWHQWLVASIGKRVSPLTYVRPEFPR
jgi:mono/diheme cytochrome c family protein